MSRTRAFGRPVALTGLALVLFATTLTSSLAQVATGERAPVAGQEMLVEEVVAWVNDDIITYSDLMDAEQQSLSGALGQGEMDGDQVSETVEKIRQQILLQMIWNRLLVQEAERLYDLEQIKRDLVEQFKKRQGIESEDELQQALDQYGMTLPMLEDRLLMSRAPDYVVEAQVLRTMGVTEDEAREWYEANREAFTTPADVVFREIVLEAATPAKRAERRAEAEKIALLAQAGQDFVELVREHSEAPSKVIDGRIGPVDPQDLIPSIASAVIDTPVGAVSDPLETPGGWHILKVEERRDAEVRPFEEVRIQAENAVRRERFGDAYDEYVKSLWDGSVVEVRAAWADRIPDPWRESVRVRD